MAAGMSVGSQRLDRAGEPRQPPEDPDWASPGFRSGAADRRDCAKVSPLWDGGATIVF